MLLLELMGALEFDATWIAFSSPYSRIGGRQCHLTLLGGKICLSSSVKRSQHCNALVQLVHPLLLFKLVVVEDFPIYYKSESEVTWHGAGGSASECDSLISTIRWVKFFFKLLLTQYWHKLKQSHENACIRWAKNTNRFCQNSSELKDQGNPSRCSHPQRGRGTGPRDGQGQHRLHEVCRSGQTSVWQKVNTGGKAFTIHAWTPVFEAPP